MNQKELDDILAMPLEERRALQRKIIEEMNDEQGEELDAKNKTKAGIAADDHSLKKREIPRMPLFVSDMQNYVLSQNKEYKVYFDDRINPGKSTLCVANINNKVIFQNTIDVYCHVCSISETGKYAAFQTANGYGEFSNQYATMLLYDVFSGKELLNKSLKTGWKDICSIEILETSKIIRLHYALDYVDYNFEGTPIDPQQVENYIFKYADTYSLEAYAYELLNMCEENISLELYEKLTYILDELKGCISPNRQSKLCKSIGKIYENMSNNNVEGALEKAISFYEKGLNIDPSLSVKKALKQLKNRFGKEQDLLQSAEQIG